MMTPFYFYYQNPLAFCFLSLIPYRTTGRKCAIKQALLTWDLAKRVVQKFAFSCNIHDGESEFWFHISSLFTQNQAYPK